MLNDNNAFSSFSVNDLAAAKEFYSNVLGIKIKESPQGLNMHIKDCAVFIYPKQDHSPATFTVLNFIVDDIDAMAAALTQAKVPLENFDTGPMIADSKGIYRGLAAGMGPDIAWFKDPAGNILSILQTK